MKQVGMGIKVIACSGEIRQFFTDYNSIAMKWKRPLKKIFSGRF